MSIPVYEIGLVVVGIVGKTLVDLMLRDIYPYIKSGAKKCVTTAGKYTPRKILQRRKERKRREEKTHELLEAVSEEFGDSEE